MDALHIFPTIFSESLENLEHEAEEAVEEFLHQVGLSEEELKQLEDKLHLSSKDEEDMFDDLEAEVDEELAEEDEAEADEDELAAEFDEQVAEDDEAEADLDAAVEMGELLVDDGQEWFLYAAAEELADKTGVDVEWR